MLRLLVVFELVRLYGLAAPFALRTSTAHFIHRISELPSDVGTMERTELNSIGSQSQFDQNPLLKKDLPSDNVLRI